MSITPKFLQLNGQQFIAQFFKDLRNPLSNHDKTYRQVAPDLNTDVVWKLQ